MLESLDEGVHGGEGGVAGDMKRVGFSHEEVFTLSYKFFTKPVWLKSAKVVRLVSDLLIAATDTTSITATWVLHILSQHKHIQVFSLCIADGKVYPPQEGVRKEGQRDNTSVTSDQVALNPSRTSYTLDL